jgi:hypothetical protein
MAKIKTKIQSQIQTKIQVLVFLSLLGLGFFKAKLALAVCPVCTVAVGAGLSLSKYLGVDDLISGVWIGGLTVSIIFWTINWFDKKKWKLRLKKPVKLNLRDWLIAISWYALIVLPLYFQGYISNAYDTFCGVDKLLFGIVSGSLLFYLMAKLHFYLKKKNNDRVYFPFQKAVFPFGALVILSLIYYIIIKYCI